MPSTAPEAESSEPTTVKHRRRWPWITALSVVAVLALIYLVVAWVLSGMIADNIRTDQPEAPFNLTVESATDEEVTYSLADTDWRDIGLRAIETQAGGWTQTSDPRAAAGSDGPATTTRTIVKQQAPPALAAGQTGRIDGDFFLKDPRLGLDLDYEDVVVPTPLGDAPAWFVPGKKDTWAIFIHGRGAPREEGLRVLSVAAAKGYPTLLITYRNDEGAPAGNGYAHFGADEWQDLDAAAQYALDNGAKRLVLLGNSMGAGISLAFLENSERADKVSGLFLDSPFLNLGRAIDDGAADLGVPDFLLSGAKALSEIRFGVDYSAVDYIDDVSKFGYPMAIAQGDADTTEPVEFTRDFVAKMQSTYPDMVTYLEVPLAEHTASWNVDRLQFEALLSDLLDRADKQ